MRSRTDRRLSRCPLAAWFLAGCGLFVEDWRVGGADGGGGAAAGGAGPGGAGGEAQGGGVPAPLPTWCRFYGTEADETLWDLRRDLDGSSLVGAAGIAGPITLGREIVPAGSTDGVIVRFDAGGVASVAAQLGASEGGVLNAVIIADRVFGVGQYLGTVGAFTSEPAGSYDAVLVDADEAILAAGTTSTDSVVDGDARDGRLVFTGVARSGIDFGAGPATSGGFIAFMSLATNTVDATIALGAGSVAGLGHMARFTPSGDFVWASASLGGPGITDVICDGMPLVTEAPEQTAILKLTSDGTCVSGRVLPVAVLPEPDLAVRGDGGLMLSGRFTTTLAVDGHLVGPASGENDAFVASLDADASFTALVPYGGTGSERPNEVILAPDGSAFVAGEFSGGLIVGNANATSIDEEGDIYVMKLDTSSEVVWVRVFGGPGRQSASALVLDTAGNLFVGGSAEGSLACDSPSPTSAGSRDMFLMRFEAQDL